MVTMRQYQQVFQSIVQSVAVVVVNIFTTLQLAAKRLLGYAPMLGHPYAVNHANQITSLDTAGTIGAVFERRLSITMFPPAAVVLGTKTSLKRPLAWTTVGDRAIFGIRHPVL
jgi:hypothetical protein